MEQPERGKNQRLYRAIVESLNTIIYRIHWDGPELHGRIDFINERALSLLEYQKSDFLKSGRSWTDLVHPEDLARLTGTYDSVQKTGTASVCHYRIRKKDGEYAWLEDAISSVSDSLVILQGMARDITESKRKDELLLSSESRLKAIVDSEPECVKTVSADGILLEI